MNHFPFLHGCSKTCSFANRGHSLTDEQVFWPPSSQQYKYRSASVPLTSTLLWITFLSPMGVARPALYPKGVTVWLMNRSFDPHHHSSTDQHLLPPPCRESLSSPPDMGRSLTDEQVFWPTSTDQYLLPPPCCESLSSPPDMGRSLTDEQVFWPTSTDQYLLPPPCCEWLSSPPWV